MGLFRLFDGARARERYYLLAKDPLRGHKSPICEELHSENFMLKFLTWETRGASSHIPSFAFEWLTYRRFLSTTSLIQERSLLARRRS